MPFVDFLYDPGTNGYIVAPFSLQTTELNGLASAAVVLSSVNGVSGVFTQTSFGNAMWGYVSFKSGGVFTPVAGGVLSGWWVNSPDGGTTFEKASAAIPRQPDFIIPLNASAYASSDIVYAPSPVLLPAPSCKVLLQNGAGVALPATGNVITAAPIAMRY